MKKAIVPAAVLSALLHLSTPMLSFGAVADRTVAVVGNEVIFKSELDSRELMTRAQYPDLKVDGDLRGRILDGLIEQKVVLAKARLDSVAIDERAIESMADDRFRQLQRRFSSREEMERQFGKNLAAIRTDLALELRNQQLVETLRRKKFAGATITHAEVMAFYRQNRADLPMIPEEVSVSQILKFPIVSAASRSAARERIEGVLQELRSGGDFALLARKYSGDPGSAPLGGELGLVQRGELVKPFEDAAWALKKGEISDIVETRYGFHLIQRLGKAPGAIRLRHILIPFNQADRDGAATIALLDSIRAEVLAGKATFAEMARRHSDDPASAGIGGSILASGSGKALFSPTGLRPQLQQVVASLSREGEISRPEKIEPPQGEAFYGLFRLDRRVAAHKPDPASDYVLLEELALEQKKQQLFERWVEELRREVYIRRMES